MIKSCHENCQREQTLHNTPNNSLKSGLAVYSENSYCPNQIFSFLKIFMIQALSTIVAIDRLQFWVKYCVCCLALRSYPDINLVLSDVIFSGKAYITFCIPPAIYWVEFTLGYGDDRIQQVKYLRLQI